MERFSIIQVVRPSSSINKQITTFRHDFLYILPPRSHRIYAPDREHQMRIHLPAGKADCSTTPPHSLLAPPRHPALSGWRVLTPPNRVSPHPPRLERVFRGSAYVERRMLQAWRIARQRV